MDVSPGSVFQPTAILLEAQQHLVPDLLVLPLDRDHAAPGPLLMMLFTATTSFVHLFVRAYICMLHTCARSQQSMHAACTLHTVIHC